MKTWIMQYHHLGRVVGRRFNMSNHNDDNWINIVKDFTEYIPSRSMWDEVDDIINILDIIGSGYSNYCFLPFSGGFHLEKAKHAPEDECIELITPNSGSYYIIKPYRLFFDYFHNHEHLSYFTIELKGLSKRGDLINEGIECLVEIGKNDYISTDEYDEHNVYVNYKESRRVFRVLHGKILITSNTNPYNNPKVYFSKHNSVSLDEFREFINKFYFHH